MESGKDFAKVNGMEKNISSTHLQYMIWGQQEVLIQKTMYEDQV